MAAARARKELLPGGSEHALAGHRTDQELVQLFNQALALVLIDDEGEVQIIRSLCDEIDLLLCKEFEGISQAMQDGADIAPDQAHRGARADDLHAAQTLKIGDERGEQRAVETIGRRIERHRDVGL